MTLRTLLLAAIMLLTVLPTPVHAQAELCYFATNLPDVPLYAAPWTAPDQQIGTITAQARYNVLAQHGGHFLVAVAEGQTGWVDRRAGGVSGSCETIPQDDRPLTDFPTICAITLTAHTDAYNDSTLLTPKGQLAPGTYIVTRLTAPAMLVSQDHAMGFWLPATAAEPFGACSDPIPGGGLIAHALPEARLWSAPDAKTAQLTGNLAAGTLVMLVGGPVRGPIRYDTNDTGLWYQVAVDGVTLGWVWEARMDFTATNIPPNPAPTTVTTTALAEARAWSQPNVRNGQVIAALPEGLPVVLQSGPISGPIRYDTNDVGDWYLVSWGAGLTGWVWSGRLDVN